MTAYPMTVAAYVIIGVLLWGYAGWLMLRLTRNR